MSRVSENIQASSDNWSGCRVLVVESQQAECSALEGILKPLGCQIMALSSGQEAINALQLDDYDLVLIDSEATAIRDIAATLATRRLETERNQWTPVIALTSEDIARAPEHFLATGLDDYLVKPMRREPLLAILRRWLQPARDSAQRFHAPVNSIFRTGRHTVGPIAPEPLHSYRSAPDFDQDPAILLATSDSENRKTGLRVLEENGLRVTLAEDGLQALTLARHTRPDLIILATSLQRLDGFDVCQQLRGLPDTQYTPIIMITEQDDSEAAQRAFDVQATDFVTSPVRWPSLVQRIRYNLRSAQVFRDLKRSEQRLANAENVANLGYWDWDMTNDIFHMSEHASHVLGHPRENLISLADYLKILHPEDMNWFYKELEMNVLNGDNWMLEYRIVTAQGEVRTIRGDGATHPNDPSWSMGTLLDITAQRRNEDTIRRMAFYDDLTGLHNRASFRDELTRSIKLHERLHAKLAVVYMDLDGFKDINDSLGHHVGDLLLQAFADRVVMQLRESDIIGHDTDSSTFARLGGDEFTILLTGLSRGADAMVPVQRIIDSLAQPFGLQINDSERHELHISSSIGIAVAPEHGSSATELLTNADSAMYAAKQAGKNTYRFYGDNNGA